MFGAVSMTDGALESGCEDVDGWYERVTGEMELFVSYTGKLWSRGCLDGDRRFARRDLIVFLLGMSWMGAVSFSAMFASRSRSTIADSAAACVPALGARCLSPSVAAALSMPEVREVESEITVLLYMRGYNTCV